MKTTLVATTFVLAFLGAVARSAPAETDEALIPEYVAADPDAPAVSGTNLLESERFWPYKVTVTVPGELAGAAERLPAGLDGVLLRVEEPGDTLLVDFGRDGRHRLPVSATDVVERANRIRRGALHKDAPNLVWAIGPRMIDSEGSEPVAYSLGEANAATRFLVVVADPFTPEFPDLVDALRPLGSHRSFTAVLLPLGRRPDREVFDRLRELEWRSAYLFFHVAEAYADTLLPADLDAPAVLLLSREGRLLFARPWRAGVEGDLLRALEQQEQKVDEGVERIGDHS
jgi:hypothetical protein